MRIIAALALAFATIILSVACSSHVQNNNAGRIMISGNNRYFTDENGDPFFWLGDTGWLLFAKLNRQDAEKYLENRSQKGFNVIQVMVLHTLSSVNVYGDSALVNKDISMPRITRGNNFEDAEQYDYWDHMDFIIDRAAEKDPVHLISYHPRGRTQSSMWFHNESWLDFNMFQSGHRRYDQEKEVYIFTSFREPAADGLYFLYSHDGYKWTDLGGPFLKPELGKQKLMRDPSIVCGPDGIFHLVWTTSWRGDNGFGYSSSKDLIHWEDQKFIPAMQHEPSIVNVWAPELYYDNESKQFIVIWASTIPFKFERGIEDEDNNHRMYYTTTKDFNTFTETRLFLDPGFSVIDAVIVKKDTGEYVLVLKDNTRPNRNLKVAFGNQPLGPYTNISEPFTDLFTEGPTVINTGEQWLIYYDAYREKKYGAVKTGNFKTFTDISSEIIVPENHKHGTIFKTTEIILKELIKEAERKK